MSRRSKRDEIEPEPEVLEPIAPVTVEPAKVVAPRTKAVVAWIPTKGAGFKA